nr:hypothetical protein CFP56_56500 [Quercus suber]
MRAPLLERTHLPERQRLIRTLGAFRGGDRGRRAHGVEHAQVDEPGGGVEFGVDGVDAVRVGVAGLGGVGFEDDKAGDGLEVGQRHVKSVMGSAGCSEGCSEAAEGTGGFATHNGCGLGCLALGGTSRLPLHEHGAVAVVPDPLRLERDRLLFPVALHELLAAGEDGLGDVVGDRGALVDDDAHGR